MSLVVRAGFAGSSDLPAVEARVVTRPSRLSRAVWAPVKLWMGMLLTQSVAGSFLILGWTFRLVQRAVYGAWWKRADPSTRGTSFEAWLVDHPGLHDHLHWPNWILAQNFRHKSGGEVGLRPLARVRRFAGALVESLARNLRIGVPAAFNTAVLTLPGCALMLFSWYAGWQNSFAKGYELFAVGPATGWLGILMFTAAMFYVPLAQAHQAASGDWRQFYRFGVVWGVIRERWLATLMLAGAYGLVALPFTALKTAVYFLPAAFPEIEQWTDAEARDFLNRYFFWSALAFLPAFVLLRLLAARIYAGGLLQGLESGRFTLGHLSEGPRQVLGELGLLAVRVPNPRPRFVRAVAWFATRTGRVLGGFLQALLWLLFVGQTIYVAEFLNAHPLLGWLNQPLIQLPFFRHLPESLEPLWDVQIAPLFLVGTAFLFYAALRGRGRSVRSPA